MTVQELAAEDTPRSLRALCWTAVPGGPSCFIPFETLDCESRVKTKTMSGLCSQSSSAAVKQQTQKHSICQRATRSQKQAVMSLESVSAIKGESSGTF